MAKWQPGQSGNPKGRRKDSHINAARMKLSCHLDQVIDAVIAAAIGGDTRAMKLILERLIPPVTADFEQLEARLNALEANSETQ